MNTIRPRHSPVPGRDTRRKSPGSTPDEAMTQSGHVTFDDRGHAVWEWIDPQAPAQAELSLADSGLRSASPAPARNGRERNGYDPYEGDRSCTDACIRRPRRDLRKLDEWIRLKKQAQRIRQED